MVDGSIFHSHEAYIVNFIIILTKYYIQKKNGQKKSHFLIITKKLSLNCI